MPAVREVMNRFIIGFRNCCSKFELSFCFFFSWPVVHQGGVSSDGSEGDCLRGVESCVPVVPEPDLRVLPVQEEREAEGQRQGLRDRLHAALHGDSAEPGAAPLLR